MLTIYVDLVVKRNKNKLGNVVAVELLWTFGVILALKEERCKNQFQSTIREGTTYERDAEMWNSSGVEEIHPATATPQVEVLSELKSMTIQFWKNHSTGMYM